jgi:predicted RNase H-related nuclease YkuK (DUF458 family)
MVKELNLTEVEAYIQKQTPETRIYIGADSEAFRRNGVWYASYAVAVCVHRMEGTIGRGVKVFGEITEERLYDKDKRKPHLRLLNEAYKLAEMYQRLEHAILDRHVELHIDINRSEEFASNAVLAQAVGYLRGVTGIEAQPKPDSPAGSFCADRLASIIDSNRELEGVYSSLRTT